ncbi:23S rRNA pseudouridine(1911/1915/1917) synthase RluD [Thioflexithrix psekupsensis]|uniref:Pseudouridine synthase n=1 Tax=Thioflexithrix psekupsensis TaxID=1570016 RepID=A0A251X5N0_9GAMM|nr:23S rRNA pseudouridine(1911/1915/1917) synthase RluD [Thioflexithrix psekupsensis]OUD12690.1 23S rRNA pseudouridine(1911/1915/1917) synthase [Thioflexithrix psekupsensis]
MTTTTSHVTTKIPPEMAGYRLDKALAELLPEYSRARLQQWIRDGHVQVNAEVLRGRDRVRGGEDVVLLAQTEDQVDWTGQSLPLSVLYEDEDVIIVNKPAGLVVHPGAGNPDQTLVNALLHYAPELAQLPRAGIIHRIDKDTSGVLAVARSLLGHTHLVAQLQAHTIVREYQAVVCGVLVSGGTVNLPIARHPTQRVRMAVVRSGKPAVTHYRVIQRYRAHTHIRARLETGRTHQIRVHLSHERYPLLGDPLYGGRLRYPPDSSEVFQKVLHDFQRQALHAERLGFQHPRTGDYMEWVVPLPEDMQQLLTALADDMRLKN